MKAILVGLFLTVLFYFPFFSKHLIPAPLDITTSMYLPWLDQQRDVFPNGGPVKNPLPSDVVSLTLPLRHLAIDIIKQGHWPLWNPKILLGTPLLANFQSAVFNPLNILYLLKTNFIDIWSIQVIMQSLLAFIFFYLFIGEYQKDIFSRLFGSLIWSFNGFFSLWFQYNTVVYAAIYLPLALFCVSRMSKNHLWGFVLAISLALSVFSGNPPVSLIVFGAVTLNVLVLYWRQPKLLITSLFFIILSIAYCAPQLFIGISSSTNSIRQNDDIATTANIKYLKPIKLLTAVIPDFFGNPSTRNTWNNYPLYDNSTIYNGILPLILFLLSLKLKFKNKQKQIVVFSYLIAIISFIVMIPSPLSNYIGSLNIFGLSSMVFTRFSFLWSLSLAIISSLVIRRLTPKVTYSFAIVAITILVPLFISYLLNRQFSTIKLIDHNWLADTKTSFRNCLYPLLILTLNFFLVTLLLRCQQKLYKNIFLILIFILTTFDLYRFFYKYNSFTSPASFYPSSELTNYLSTNSFRFARESSQLIPSNMWLMYPSLQTPSGYDTTYSREYGQYISLVNGSNLQSITNRYLEIDKFNSPLVDLLSVDHIIATKKDRFGLSDSGSITDSLINPKFILVKDFGRYVVLKNSSSLPFVRPIKQIVVSKSLSDTEKYLLQKNINDLAIVTSPISNSDKLNSQVIIDNLSFNTQKISFTTTTNNSSLPYFLVISQNYDSGWQVKIDNIPGTLTRTNHTFTGLFLSPGNHQITLEYQPSIFSYSLKIFAISTFLSLLYIIFNILWKKLHS